MAATILDQVYDLVADRKRNPVEGSYTCRLFREGKEEILKKFGEEAVEVIVAAAGAPRERVVAELADLTYHAVVLMVERGIAITDVASELEKRFRESSS